MKFTHKFLVVMVAAPPGIEPTPPPLQTTTQGSNSSWVMWGDVHFPVTRHVNTLPRRLLTETAFSWGRWGSRGNLLRGDREDLSVSALFHLHEVDHVTGTISRSGEGRPDVANPPYSKDEGVGSIEVRQGHGCHTSRKALLCTESLNGDTSTLHHFCSGGSPVNYIFPHLRVLSRHWGDIPVVVSNDMLTHGVDHFPELWVALRQLLVQVLPYFGEVGGGGIDLNRRSMLGIFYIIFFFLYTSWWIGTKTVFGNFAHARGCADGSQ